MFFFELIVRFSILQRKDFTKPDNRSRICHKHFKPEDFHNYGMFQNKLASRLILLYYYIILTACFVFTTGMFDTLCRLFLKKDAIPSFLNSVNDEQTEEAVVSDCAQRLALRGAVRFVHFYLVYNFVFCNSLTVFV